MEIIKEVVVVEGYHDLAKLRAIYPNLDIVITNGSEIEPTTLDELKKLNETRGLILFLDPDYQGERIRRIINEHVGQTKHAFIEKKKCINKNGTKVGVEHASNLDIIESMNNTFSDIKIESNTLTHKDLIQYGLMGAKNAKKKREFLTSTIGIGLSNGKTLLRKLNMFQIKKSEIASIIEGELWQK